MFAQTHMLVVGAVRSGGFGPGEVAAQFHVGRSAPQSVRIARPQRVPDCAALLLGCAALRRLVLLQPPANLVAFRLSDQVRLEEVRVTVKKRLHVRKVKCCHCERGCEGRGGTEVPAAALVGAGWMMVGGWLEDAAAADLVQKVLSLKHLLLQSVRPQPDHEQCPVPKL